MVRVKVNGGSRVEGRDTIYHKYHKTFREAHNYLIGTIGATIKQVKANLQRLENAEKRILKIKESDYENIIEVPVQAPLSAEEIEALV